MSTVLGDPGITGVRKLGDFYERMKSSELIQPSLTTVFWRCGIVDSASAKSKSYNTLQAESNGGAKFYNDIFTSGKYSKENFIPDLCLAVANITLDNAPYATQVNNTRGLLDGIGYSIEASINMSSGGNITVSIPETTFSFVDAFFHPWMLECNSIKWHYPDMPFKTLDFYLTLYYNDGVTPKTQYRFYECLPTSITTITNTRNAAAADDIMRTVTLAYGWSEIRNNL